MKTKLLLLLLLYTICHCIFGDGVQPIGNGTDSDPYLIASLDNLLWLSTNSNCWDCHFKQIADIDAADTQNWNQGEGFSPIGVSWTQDFQGIYDGNGFIISNLYINQPNTWDDIGFFGTTENSLIKNLGLINVNIAGAYNVGGIVGFNATNSIIKNCYSTGSVSGIGEVGGIAGYQYENSQIINCYSTSSITGTNNPGGIVGVDHASQTINSFWDINVSGISVSGGGTGKSTTEMKTISTFTDTSTPGLSSPWDFVNNPYDDTNNEEIWNIEPATNGGYPYICLQDTVTEYVCDFNVSTNLCFVDSLISFANLSTGDFTQFLWDFENDGVIDSYDTDPQIAYNCAGIIDVSLKAETDSMEIVELKENYITVLEYSPQQSEIILDGSEDISFFFNSGIADDDLHYQWYINGVEQVDTTKSLQVSFDGNSVTIIEGVACSGNDQISKIWRIEVNVASEESMEHDIELNLDISPNPFNPSTNIMFSLSERSYVDVIIYNIRGQEVRNLHNGIMNKGKHSLVWDGMDKNSKNAASGIYFIVLSKNNETQQVRKCVMIK